MSHIMYIFIMYYMYTHVCVHTHVIKYEDMIMIYDMMVNINIYVATYSLLYMHAHVSIVYLVLYLTFILIYYDSTQIQIRHNKYIYM